MFEAVLQAVVALSMDPFGNYLIQKLLQYGVSVQRTRLVHTAAPSIMEIAVNVTRRIERLPPNRATFSPNAARGRCMARASCRRWWKPATQTSRRI